MPDERRDLRSILLVTPVSGVDDAVAEITDVPSRSPHMSSQRTLVLSRFTAATAQVV